MKAYQPACHFMYMNHEKRSSKSINSCTTKSAQRSNPHVSSLTWNIKNVRSRTFSSPLPTPSSTQAMASVATGMSLHEEQAPRNLISPTPPYPIRNTDVAPCLWEVRSKKCAFSARPSHQQTCRFSSAPGMWPTPDTVDGCEILRWLIDGLSHYNPIVYSVS